jgi:hypothetical protein
MPLLKFVPSKPVLPLPSHRQVQEANLILQLLIQHAVKGQVQYLAWQLCSA